MGPEKQPASFQSLEIAPDGIVGNAKMIGQIIDADLAFGFHQLKQLLMTLSEGNTLVFTHCSASVGVKFLRSTLVIAKPFFATITNVDAFIPHY